MYERKRSFIYHINFVWTKLIAKFLPKNSKVRQVWYTFWSIQWKKKFNESKKKKYELPVVLWVYPKMQQLVTYLYWIISAHIKCLKHIQLKFAFRTIQRFEQFSLFLCLILFWHKYYISNNFYMDQTKQNNMKEKKRTNHMKNRTWIIES